ncbi:HNH endonuclease signature motif containing protein [Nocardioides flavescens]|uniref:DUF222 domain-containing protein n=1 Tax=Nocardioides flavescens TaxID=2691959 RepID=A0A6L7EVI3_9ACTN|nr:HNH endonuclease signature motif containing protein [Nocardioides flavescens]MXG88205.1 DUF222 domain-containing protein [Nocardioides flavescens]
MAATTTPTHRVSRAVSGMRTAATDLAEVPVWTMDAAETEATLVELLRLRTQVESLSLRLLAHADALGVAGRAGAASTAHWYAHRTRLTRAQAHRETRAAAALQTHPATAEALATGALHLDQALAVTRAVDQLPDDLDRVDDTLRDRAEHELLDQAADFDARHLKTLGTHLVEVVAPDIAEAHTARLLQAEERAAAADQRLVLHDDGHGRVHGRFTLDATTGAMLRTALLAIAAPKHQSATHDTAQGPIPPRRPAPERMGAAFAEYVARYPATALPETGGLAATVMVTMTLADLLGHTDRPATLTNGHTISAAQARRIACEAGLLPAVLATDGRTVLDLGRTTRLFTSRQRLALAIRDRGCTTDGCDWPPAMTHAHHDTPWAAGGPTDLHNGRLLCPFHHTRAHDPAYRTEHLPGGKITFHRRE